ncbi:MAG: hypothetical protein JOZ51_06815, partial [Chloroflexi bacterium]|nr:hypothetical protein [Chloroflexota bacterium]
MSANPKSFIGQFFIKVDGSDIPTDAMDALTDAVVEDDVAQPAMFALRFNDPKLQLTDGDQFKLGREVTLAASAPGGQSKTIMTGEITALEPEFDQHTPTLTVRGYDRSHRLYRGRKTRTFLNQTDSDIASQIAR